MEIRYQYLHYCKKIKTPTQDAIHSPPCRVRGILAIIDKITIILINYAKNIKMMRTNILIEKPFKINYYY
ncbi:hypothetical protein [Methanobrevibacter sp.]|uniref:hypothetical protein n=1 Tax=Methanobrevibacter sp. TaxID=66852 RepID=UPI00388E9E19